MYEIELSIEETPQQFTTASELGAAKGCFTSAALFPMANAGSLNVSWC